MNQDNLNALFRNYIERFEELNRPSDNNEKYKWDAIGQVQKCWDLSADNLADMIKQSFSLSYNLVNNRIVQPVSGLVALARIESEAVRNAFSALLVETGNIDQKQNQILAFVDSINALLEKHFSGKWKYTQDIRAVIAYLSMIKPAQNYMFKSTPAHSFARYMGYENDIGYGQAFKLRYYYAMCDELVEYIKATPTMIEIDATRASTWKDPSYHVLAYDLIFCFEVYHLVDGMREPAPSGKASNMQQGTYRVQKAAELQTEIEKLQDQIDLLQSQKDDLPEYNFEGLIMRTKAFGTVNITRQDGRYLVFKAGGKERQFVLPGCVSNGVLSPDDPEMKNRYDTEASLQGQIENLDRQQRAVNRELEKYQF